MIKTILFDLDGTLLPLDEDQFIKRYFDLLGKKFYSLGYNPQTMLDAVWEGTKAMVNNSGFISNEDCFWNAFEKKTGLLRQAIEQELILFYENDFDFVQKASISNPNVKEIIASLIEKKVPLILATNPIFPQIATYKRIRWAGLDPKSFFWITTYENSYFSKPNLKYYQWLLEKFNLLPSECLMVGNDVEEDMIASQLGIKTFLVTDCLNNRLNKDINLFDHGNMASLKSFLLKQTYF
ncbi:MAG: HAD family hydrolase [Bacilli bacterium]